MGQRIEAGAGVAAMLLAIGAFALLLFAPLLPTCAHLTNATCPPSALQHVALVSTRLDASAWALLVGTLLVALLGGAGALLDARGRWRPAIVLLGMAAALGLLVCVLGVTGLAILYLPAVLAVEFAAYGALLWRRAARNPASGAADTSAVDGKLI